MIRFVTKEGKEAMVVKDNGEVTYKDKALKESVEKKKAEDKKVEKTDD